MNPLGIFFAILSPALYSGVNYVDKFLLEKFEIDSGVISVFSGIFAILASLIIMLFTGLTVTNPVTIAVIIASGFYTQIYLVPYFKALSLDDASRVVPLSQIVPVMVLILSYFILGESLNSRQYIGSILIVAACFLLAMDKPSLNIFRFRKAFWYMMIASLCIALSYVLFKFAVEEVSFWQALPYEGFGIALGTIAILLFPNNLKRVKLKAKKLPRKVFGYMSLNEIIFLLSRYTAFYATSLIPVSMVSILYGFQPLFLIIFGSILSIWFPYLIKEVLSKETIVVKIFATLLIVGGLYFVFI